MVCKSFRVLLILALLSISRANSLERGRILKKKKKQGKALKSNTKAKAKINKKVKKAKTQDSTFTCRDPSLPAKKGSIRFASFNGSMNRFNAGDLVNDLSDPSSNSTGTVQAKTIATIVQINDPDVLLLNEFDYDTQDAGGTSLSLRLFAEDFLMENYPYYYSAPSNTGIPSGRDFNKDGDIFGGNDAFGFGWFPGQYGMAVYSKYPIDFDGIRTFQKFLWKDMPDASLPTNSDGSMFYDEEDLNIFRLSSKSHWDVPIEFCGETVHFLVSHPTPPVFDGPEDRNGKRNHDEIRFFADYISGADYIYDDNGLVGGLDEDASFVIAGDLNADPFDGDSYNQAILLLLDHPLVNTCITPSSEGGKEQSELQGGINTDHLGDPRFDTSDFYDVTPGNLRVDYCLPSKTLDLLDANVYWPLQSSEEFSLVGLFPFPSSDHRLVSVDVDLPTEPCKKIKAKKAKTKKTKKEKKR